jgi:MarR family transcriptional regulator, organic hydroperoxide resistance regulator
MLWPERRSAGAEETRVRAITENDETAAIRVWFRLARLSSLGKSVTAEKISVLDLSVPQCDVLTTLTEREGISQQELAQRLYVTKGNISGLLDRLERLGLVERRATPGDRRQYAIALTETGRAKAKAAIAIQLDIIGRSIGKLPKDGLAQFEALIVQIRDSLRAISAAEADAVPDAAE